MSQIQDILDKSPVTRDWDAAKRAELLDQAGAIVGEDESLSRGEHREIRDKLNSAKSFGRNTEVSPELKEDLQGGKTFGPNASMGLAQAALPKTPEGEVDERTIGPYAPWQEKVRSPMGILRDAADFAMDVPKAIPRLPLNLVNLAAWGSGALMELDPGNILQNRFPEGKANGIKRMEAVKEWSRGILDQLSEDDPKMAELNDQLLMDGVASVLFGGTTTVAKAGVMGAARAAGTSFGAGAVGGQVVAGVLEEPIKAAMKNPDDINIALLGATVVGALVGGVGTEHVLNRLARNPALVRDARAVGQAIIPQADEATDVERIRGMLDSEDITPETRQAFDRAVAAVEAPDEVVQTPITAEVTERPVELGMAPRDGTAESVQQVLSAEPNAAMSAAPLKATPATTAESAQQIIQASPPTPEGWMPDPVQPSNIAHYQVAARTGQDEADMEMVKMLSLRARAMGAEQEMVAKVGAESTEAIGKVGKADLVQGAKLEMEALEEQKMGAQASWAALQDEIALSGSEVNLGAARMKQATGALDEISPLERRALNLDDEMTAIDLRERKLVTDFEGMVRRKLGPMPSAEASLGYRKLSAHLLKDAEFKDGVRLAQMQKEATLGRALSRDERTLLVEDLVQRRGSWYQLEKQRARAPRLGDEVSPEIRSKQGIRHDSPVFSSQHMAGKYPLAAKAIGLASAKGMDTPYFSLNDVARAATAFNRAAGPHMSDEVFTRMLPYGKEMNQVWDIVRGLVEPEASTSLLEGLKGIMPQKEWGKAGALVKGLEEQFGARISEIALARAGEPGSAASYQLTRRRISLGEDNLQSFTHELGHHVFYHGLSADERIGFLLQLRKDMARPNGWARAFPKYAEALKAMERQPMESAARTQMWISSPEEAFAQQTVAVLGTNYLPNARTATGLQRAVDQFSSVLGLSFDDFKSLPDHYKQMFTKSVVMPKLERLAAAQTTTFDDVAWELTTIPKDLEGALSYADELEEMLTAKAGIRVPVDVLEDMHIGELLGDAFAGMETTPPAISAVAGRVMGYKLVDLNSALTMQLIRGMGKDAKFDLAEFKLLVARLDNTLNTMPDADVMLRLLAQDSVQVRATKGIRDAYTGLENESFQIQRAQKMESAVKEAARTGDGSAFQASYAFKAQLQAYGKRKTEMQLRYQRNLTEEEATQLRRSVDIEFASKLPQKEIARLDLQNSNARLAYEALQAEGRPLLEAAQKLLVNLGDADNIPISFMLDMKAADDFSKLSTGKMAKDIAWSTAWRSTALAAASVESDEENGISTPFGKVSFTLDGVLAKGAGGMAALALIGGKPAVWTVKTMVEQGQKALRKLSPKAQGKMETLFRGIRAGLGPKGGLTDEQNQLLQAFKRDKQTAKVEALELAKILEGALTPKERSTLSMLVTNDIFPGWESSVAGANKKVQILAETVKGMYDKTANELLAAGVSPKKLEEVQSYMNRVYMERAPIKRGKWTLNKAFIKQPMGMRLDFLKERGMVHVVEPKTGSPAFADKMFPDQQGSSKALAHVLQGMKAPENADIMSYRVLGDSGMERVYAVKGTEMERHLAGSNNAFADEVGWKVQKLHKNSVALRRDYTHGERAVRGETMDASVKLAQFGEASAHDIAKMKMYNRIAETPGAVQTGEVMTEFGAIPSASRTLELQSSWYKVPDVEIPGTGAKKFGQLSGKYVSPETRDVLKAVDAEGGLGQAFKEHFPNSYAAHKFALGAWKMAKTVAQPATHVTNIVGNLIQGWLAGENPISTVKHGAEMLLARNFDIKYNDAIRKGDAAGLQQLVGRLTESPALHENWNLYKNTRHMQLGESSILSSDASVQELLKESLNIENALRVGDVSSDIAAATGMMDKLINGQYVKTIMGGAKAVGRGAANFYELGDLGFKLGVYKTVMMEGGTPEMALSRAYKAHFDYGALPKIPQMLKDSGIMPFASYAYKAAELMVDTAAKRPGRLAVAALLLEGYHYKTMQENYGLENMIQGAEFEQAAIFREGTASRRLGLFRSQLATGAREETDVWENARDVTRYANVGYYIPGGDMFETSSQIVPKDGTGTTLGAIVSGVNALAGTAMGSPLLSIATAAATGQDTFLHRPLGSLDSAYVPGTNDEKQKSQDFGKFMWRTMLPNLPIIPGTYSNDRLMKGLAHSGYLSEGVAEEFGVTGYNSLGMPMDILTQSQNFLGLRMSSVDADESMSRRLTRINLAEKEASKATTRILRNPAIPEGLKVRAEDDLEKVLEKKEKEAFRLEDLYSKGMTAKEKLQRAVLKKEASAGARPALGF